jgi:HEAT repeats/PBS lyase HEAT-like repeat
MKAIFNLLFISISVPIIVAASGAGASGIDEFTDILNQDNVYLKCYAIHNIGYRWPRAIDQLVPFASDADERIRKAAYFTIGLNNGSGHLEVFKRGIKDREPEVRRYALMGLARIDDGNHLETAKELYRDSSPRVREMLAMAVYRYRYKPLLGHMVRLLEDASPRVCRAAAIAIGNIGDRRALKYLQELMTRLELSGESKLSMQMDRNTKARLKVRRNFPFGFSYFPELFEKFAKRAEVRVTLFQELAYQIDIGAESRQGLDNIKLSVWNLDAQETLNKIVDTAGGYWYIDMGRIFIAPGAYKAADTPLKLEVAYAMARLGDKTALKTIKSYLKHELFGQRAKGMLEKIR